MNFHIVSLFPESFTSYLGESILKRAIEDKKIRVKFYNPRDFATTKKKPSYTDRRVDGRPYGGGPGMIIEALPVIKAIAKAKGRKTKVKIVWFTPGGETFSNTIAKGFTTYKDIIFICGRYEGIDARVKKAFKVEEISVGPYVLTGGELPSMIVMDAVSRQIKGVLGDFDSLEENRIASHDVYTRPETIVWKGKKLKVPEVLLSGNHQKIEEWKQENKG